MATTKSWGGLGVAPGTVMTNAVAGTGDTAFTSVTGTAPVVQNALFRWPAIQYDQLAAAVSHLNWTITGTHQLTIRWYGQYTGAASAAVSILQGLVAGGQQFRVEIAGTGGTPPAQIRIRNAVNTQVGDSGGNALPLGFAFVFEAIYNLGLLTINVYLVGVQTPAFSASAFVGDAAIDQLRIGNVVTTTLPRFWIDDIVVTDTAAPIPQVGAGTDDGSIRPLQYNCNRVAGTLVNGVPTLDAQGAANRWAFTSGLSLVQALNVKAGNTLPAYKDLLGVCNQLAGTTGLGENGASSRWAAG